jgi:hypothetical protein
MDSGNISEVDDKVTQPVEAVAADAEVKLEEQHSSEEETELFIEEEGEQTEAPKKDGMTDEQAKAAFRQEREKRKAKTKQNDELQQRLDAQAKELVELRETVGKVSRGAKPSILDYSTDEEYLADVDKWNGGASESKPMAAEAVKGSELSEDQAWHLYKNEEDIKKSFSDYDDVKNAAIKAFEKAGVENSDIAMKQVAAVCHEHDINSGKVNYAIGRFPAYAEKLLKASNTNQSAVRSVLRELEGKVKARTRKKIDSEPEPKVKSNGSVNVGSEAEKKAWAEWQGASSGDKIGKYKELQKIRKANKA